MRGALKVTGVALCATLAAAAARSEVRLAAGSTGLTVQIDSTPRGPWTPTGSITSVVLNPSGDLFGDSMPGWDSRGSRVLSAWIRPGSGFLHRSLGTSPGWAPLDSMRSDGAVGQPVVDDLTDGWSVTWQQSSSGSPRVLVTGTTVDGAAVDPLVVDNGTLIGTSPNGNLLYVITMDSSGLLWCTTVAFAFIPTQPIPIQLAIVAHVKLGRTGQLNGGSPSPNARSNRFDSGEIEAVGAPRVVDIPMGDGVGGLVTWLGTDDEVHAVRLSGDGPVLPGKSVKMKGNVRITQAMDQVLAASTSD